MVDEPREISDSVKQRINQDLYRRSRPGIIFYLVLWLITAVWFDLYNLTPFLFKLTTGFWLIFFIIRTYHLQRYNYWLKRNPELWIKGLVFFALLSAIAWSATAIMIYTVFGLTSEIGIIMLLSALGLGVGASNLFSPLRGLSLGFLFSIVLPSVIYSIMDYHFELALMGILFVSHVAFICVSQNKEYISALKNEFLLIKHQQELEKLNQLDPLTKIANRRHFENRFHTDFYFAQRQNLPLALLVIDIDHFKKVNDTLGHLVGDHCIVHIANALVQSVRRKSDLPARYGGEEFVIALPATDIKGASRVAERVRKFIESTPVVENEVTINLTVSIGIAILFNDQTSIPDELFNRADKALYQAKNGGRNQICVYEEPVDRKTKSPSDRFTGS